MIYFSCWYCGRRYHRPVERRGERFECSCGRRNKVPRRNDGYSRAKSLLDWIVEAVVYGGAGALLGFAFAALVLSKFPLFRIGQGRWDTIAAATIVGFLFGVIGGEAGINWIGRRIRDRENR
jgi:hypothetical protein